MGKKSKNLAFTKTKIMIFLEIQRSKNKTFSTVHTDLNLMTYCSICLDRLSVYSGNSISLYNSNLTPFESKYYVSRLYIRIMSTNTVNKIKTMGNNLNVIVKTLQINFSNIYLEETTNNFHGDTHLVMYSDNN